MYIKLDSIKSDIIFYTIIGIILGVVGYYFMFWAIDRVVDNAMDNQDTMLCNSAKISGNAEFLEKCICFYESNNISCIERTGK